MPSKKKQNSGEKKGSKKKTLFWIIGIIVGLALLALLMMFVVRYFAKTKSDVDRANAAGLVEGGVVASVKSDDEEFFSNPTQVASYVSSACGLGHNYMPTSKSPCERIPVGAETISETEWLKRLALRAKKGDFGFPADKIIERSDRAALAAMRQCVDKGYVEKKYRGKPDDPAVIDAALAASSQFCTYYTSSCKLPNWENDWNSIAKLNRHGTMNSTYSGATGFCHRLSKVINDASKDDCSSALKLFKQAYSDEFSVANCAADNKDYIDPSLEGLYVIYPMTPSCQAIKDAETDKCIESVNKLVADGTVSSLVGLNQAAMNVAGK